MIKWQAWELRAEVEKRMKPDEIRASLNRRVIWRSPNKEKAREYIFTGAIFRRGEKEFFYQAEL